MSQSDVNNMISDLYKRLEPLLENNDLVDKSTRDNFHNLTKIIADASVKVISPKIEDLVPYEGTDYVLANNIKSKKNSTFLGIDIYQDNTTLFNNILMIFTVIFFIIFIIMIASQIPVYLWPVIFLIIEYLVESYNKGITMDCQPKQKEPIKQIKQEISNVIKIKEKEEEKERILAKEEEKRKEEALQRYYDRRDYDRRDYDRRDYDRRDYDRKDYDRREEYYYKNGGTEYYYKKSDDRYDRDRNYIKKGKRY